MDRGAWRATAHGVTKSGTPPRSESTEAVFSPSKKKPRFAQGRWSVQRTCTLGFPIGQHWFSCPDNTLFLWLFFSAFLLVFSFSVIELFKRHKDQARRDSVTTLAETVFDLQHSLSWVLYNQVCVCVCVLNLPLENWALAQMSKGNQSVVELCRQPQLSALVKEKLQTEAICKNFSNGVWAPSDAQRQGWLQSLVSGSAY